jgi:hypothetical protein
VNAAAVTRDPIEGLCVLDAGGRGIGTLLRPGALAAAARALAGARRVVLVTGFVARPGWPAETDGPSGTVVLGRALRRLGARVLYLADPPVAPLLAACLRALRQPRELAVVPAEAGAALAAARRLAHAFAPTHLVAVERPGRAADGGYYNARGRAIGGVNAPLDGLFLGREWPLNGHGARPVTVGVGDGGNEVGMGRVRARVARDVPNGRRIGSVVRTDHLVVAGTSNWGAWGLTAHLGLLAGRPLLHTEDEEARLTRAMIAAGGVDGLTGAARPTVDSLPLAVHQRVLATLRALAAHLAARTDGAAAAPRPARIPEPTSAEKESA